MKMIIVHEETREILEAKEGLLSLSRPSLDEIYFDFGATEKCFKLGGIQHPFYVIEEEEGEEEEYGELIEEEEEEDDEGDDNDVEGKYAEGNILTEEEVEELKLKDKSKEVTKRTEKQELQDSLDEMREIVYKMVK